jgi:hypothetical protein
VAAAADAGLTPHHAAKTSSSARAPQRYGEALGLACRDARDPALAAAFVATFLAEYVARRPIAVGGERIRIGDVQLQLLLGDVGQIETMHANDSIASAAASGPRSA